MGFLPRGENELKNTGALGWPGLLRCPGARSAQEAIVGYTLPWRLPVAFGDPDKQVVQANREEQSEASFEEFNPRD